MSRRFFILLTSLLACLSYGCDLTAKEAAVSPKAYEIFNLSVFNIPITNAMITSWVFSLLIICIVRCIVGRRAKMIPGKGQAVLEVAIESLKNMLEPIVGKRMIHHVFPLLLGFFIFILIHNWSGLLPGVGAFGKLEHGHLVYFFRPGNADLNMTFALSIIAFAAWLYYVLRYAGVKVLIHDLFGNKADKQSVNPMVYYMLFLIFIAVGFIEVVSILFRLVSLSFRLFGNVFGGENLLTSITGIMSYVLPVPFYFLEVLIGLIQAFVFTLLSAIYIGLICNHGEEDSHAH